jgi:FkbH-like protein
VTSDLFADLAWLPRPPSDFRQRCRDLAQAGDNFGRRVQALATHALAASQLQRLAGVIGDAIAQDRSLAPLAPFRLGLLGNGTLDLIVPALVASAARHGVALQVVRAEYGQIAQQAMSPDSQINRSSPDAVLLALDYRAFPLTPSPGMAEAAKASVDAAVAMLDSIRTGIATHAKVPCIVQTLAPPAEPLFGSIDPAVPGTARHLIDAFDDALVRSIAGTPDLLLDIAGLAGLVGVANWHAPNQWNLAKLPFADAYVPLYADHVGRLLGAMRGKARRCLILDLDNTVWGGVIGDDGLDGIVIAEGDPVGEAFRSVQRLALALRERGIVLAVSSKNTDEVARLAFQKHPEMLLRESHITVFQANWSDKAANIRAIAEALSLGLDAMVFLDDNPVERGLVRQLVPEVAVPELPDDPALYARTLMAAGYFEATAFSAEDRQRAEFYQGNARRAALQKQSGDLDVYLASLDMEITFQPFDSVGRARITQLINKSNQFNLTTRRYSEAEVAAAEARPDWLTLQVRLTDVYGDNGMIAVVICRPAEADAWEIDTWLMSCRVLGRKVEEMTLREILRQARERGISRVIGCYRPTERNGMVRDHYQKLGFAPTDSTADGTTRWELPTDTEVPCFAMRVRMLETAAAV